MILSVLSSKGVSFLIISVSVVLSSFVSSLSCIVLVSIIIPNSLWGLGITWFEIKNSLPNFFTAAIPASMEAFTAPTSPVMVIVTNPPPTYDFSRILTSAAFTIISAPSTAAINPFVSSKPNACID